MVRNGFIGSTTKPITMLIPTALCNIDIRVSAPGIFTGISQGEGAMMCWSRSCIRQSVLIQFMLKVPMLQTYKTTLVECQPHESCGLITSRL